MTQEGALKAVQKYGVPTAVALVLGYVLIAEVRADQKIIKEQHALIVKGIAKVADQGSETRVLQEQLLRVMRVMCIQAADTAAERRECLEGDR